MVGIKGMEMPISCGFGCYCVTTGEYGELICPLLNHKNVDCYGDKRYGRPNDCPLVEVEDQMIVRKEVYLCKNPTGNKYCDYTQQDKKKQCNYEERCGASYLDCKFCLKSEEITKVSIK